MLFWTMRKKMKLCDIKSINIDEFYHLQVGFDKNSDEAQRFVRVCKKLYEALHGKPRVVGHYIIHLFLLVDSLLEEYASGWEPHLADKLNDFDERRRKAADDVRNRRETEYERYYSEYGQLTQTRSDDANTIRRRHAFFTKEILNLLSPKKLDTKRSFTDLERKIVFFRDMELCQFCRMNEDSHKILWEECDIHHVTPHANGGATNIDNAALVHRDCHPNANVEKFREWWLRTGPARLGPSAGLPERGKSYAEKRMSARTESGQLVVEFVEDGISKRWDLPDRSDREAIRRLREEAVAFALDHGASNPGQANAVRKALTNGGYYIR